MATKIWIDFEDIEWIKPIAKHIDQNKIVSKTDLSKLDEGQYKVIERYI